MKRIGIILSIMFVFSLLMFGGCTKTSEETIKIGIIGPMNFLPGETQWNGAEMAANEINARGGVKVGNVKMKIELIKTDSNESVSMTDATNAMEKLCTSDKADFIVGGFRTEAVFAMQDIAMDNKKIFIGCGAADDLLCGRLNDDYERYKYWFRGTPFKSSLLGQTIFCYFGAVVEAAKKELKIENPKVAIVAEKAQWTAGIVNAAKIVIPKKFGLEIVGLWQPSAAATDVTSELSSIQGKGADIIFTAFSGPVGVTFVKQANEIKIPAIMVGINVEGTNTTFHEATGGMSDYVVAMTPLAKTIEQNKLTKPFINAYIKNYGSMPVYTAATYDAIKYNLVPAIEEAKSLDPELIIPVMEKREFLVPSGKVKYTPEHDLTWGPGYLTSLGVQWQNGELVGIWPNGWVAEEGMEPLTYKGMVPIKFPPALVEKYKKQT